MAVMMGKLYAALREANVPEDKAREAAEEVASFENRLASIDARLLVLWAIVPDLTFGGDPSTAGSDRPEPY